MKSSGESAKLKKWVMLSRRARAGMESRDGLAGMMVQACSLAKAFIARSRLVGEVSQMQYTGFVLVLMVAVCTPALGAGRAHERVCLTAGQAREMIGRHKLAEPFRLMKGVVHRFQAEAIGVKLCRRKDEFIYEISLLRRDGRVIHVFLNAVNGKILRAINVR